MSEGEKVAAELPPGGILPNLRAYAWQPSYSHEDGDLVELFFLPVLSCARLYQRVTGYFNQEALVLASRGLENLIHNDGRMELIVGCTLEQDEVDAIETGYALRTLVTKNLHSRLAQVFEQEFNRKNLGQLSWMIAHNYLDVKVAIPKDAEGKFRAGLGLYHAKSGMVEDGEGNRLVFRGSLNETHAGWRQNFESFDVSCSWRGEFDAQRVDKTRDEFNALWQNKAQRAEVIEVPEAVKKELLKFLPAEPPPGAPDLPPPVATEDADEEPAVEAMTPALVTDAPPAVEEETPARPEAEPEPTSEAAVEEEPEAELPVPPVAPIAPRRPRMSPEAALSMWKAVRDAPKGDGGPHWAMITSTVNPWPHQLRAYRRMLDGWPFRLLIADEVGLGKTIEAGLMLRYLHISGKAKRILIMAPKAVLQQWQNELYEKFNLLAPIYTGKSLVWPKHHGAQEPLERPASRTDWTREPIVLVSSHLMRRKDRQGELIDAEDWDLIALDEAHHARRRGAGSAAEGGPNHLLTLMQKIKEKSPALLLMTATPMQVAPIELYDLLNLLGLPEEWTADAFLDYFELLQQPADAETLFKLTRMFQSTEAMYGPLSDEDLQGILTGKALSPVDWAALRTALREHRHTIPLGRLSDDARGDLRKILQAASPIRFLMSRHTRPLLREYAKRGLLDSPIAERDVRDVAITMNPQERALYEAVEEYISETYKAASPDKKNAVGFVMTIYRRRVASSFQALKCTLNMNLERLKGFEPENGQVSEDVSDDEHMDEAMSEEEALDLEREALNLLEEDAIQSMLRSIAQLGIDSKALRLVKELNQAESDGIEGAIVFTQYTDTMEFLKDFLADRLEGKRIGCYYGKEGKRLGAGGAWLSCRKDQMKAMVMRGEIDVLLCTDAAGEGLNLQSCGMLVNYDLPWNPMRVEQRIGRIDRIGQKHPVVRVVNLGYADTVEVDVYFALSERIGLFSGLVGKLQPILSRLPQEFAASIRETSMTPEEARKEAVRRALENARKAEESGFDIDETTETDLRSPDFIPSSVTPADVERILLSVDEAPGGFQVGPLDEGSFKMSEAGADGASSYRVTARPGLFDLSFQSTQLLVHGAPVFERVVSAIPEE